VSGYDELWSGSAAADLDRFPPPVQAQIRLLVRRVCEDPAGGGTQEVPGLRRTRVLKTGLVGVFYQVDDLDRLVYVTRVTWRG
jgi:mRNA-degrading endonuclease RelE of RelBE toxin-antitoxin system